MKAQSLLIALAFALGACSTELEIASTDLPAPVNSAFQAKYPGAEDVEWELEKEDGRVIYEAEFKHEGKNKEAHFAADGTVVDGD